MISAHKGTEMSVLLSMSGAIQRPHICEYYSYCLHRLYRDNSFNMEYQGGEDENAAESFFRGPGRNLLTVLLKSNISDKVSMAFDGVKRYYKLHYLRMYSQNILCDFRIIESGEEVVMRTRIPRYVNPMVCSIN